MTHLLALLTLDVRLKGTQSLTFSIHALVAAVWDSLGMENEKLIINRKLFDNHTLPTLL